MATTLAESLAAGDPEAFAALYDRLASRLFNTARTMTGSTPEAEDVVHDVFVALAGFHGRLGRITDLEAYVFTMLRHAVSRRRRRRDVERRAIDRVGRRRAAAGQLTTQPVEPPDDELTAAVATLPPAQREVLALKIDGGLTFAEIATVIGTSINTAASRYRYAVEKKVTATKSGKDAQDPSPCYADLVAVTFLPGAAIAFALSLLLASILPQLAMHAEFQPPGWQPLPTLAERGRAAGIEFDLAPAHAGRLAVGAPMTHSQASPAHALRSIDLSRLLEGEL